MGHRADFAFRAFETLFFACAVALAASASAQRRSEPPSSTFSAVVSREEAVVVTVRAIGIPGFGGFDEKAWKDPP